MNPQSQRAPFAWGIVAVFCAVLGTGLLVPVYADEVASVLMRGMFFDNGWRFDTLLPQCNAAFLQTVPWLHLPGAVVGDALYSVATPLGVRLRGLLLGFAWLAVTAVVITGWMRSRVSSAWLLAGFVSILGLGVLPLTLIMMRNEQMMLLLLSVFLGFPMLVAQCAKMREHGKLALLAVAFCIAASLFFYVHPKTLFFVPLVLGSALASFVSRSKFWGVVVTVFVLACAWQGFRFAEALTQCPGAPQMSAMVAANTMALGGIFKNPNAFVLGMIANLENVPVALLKHLVFADSYQSAWLAAVPGLSNRWFTIRLNDCIDQVLNALYWGALVLPPSAIAYKLARRECKRTLMLLCGLWIALLGHVTLYTAWNFYAATLLVPLLAWCVVLSLAELIGSLAAVRPVLAGRLSAILVLPFWLLFIASATVLVFQVLPATLTSQRSADGGLPSQGLSVPTLDYGAQRSKVRDLAAQCHVGGDGARRLVIDNLTLFAFDDLHEPLHSDYLYEHGFGVDLKGDALPRLLKRLGSPAIIAQCAMFPSVFAGKMHREGNLCCVDLTGER